LERVLRLGPDAAGGEEEDEGEQVGPHVTTSVPTIDAW
jgi:hypothetical protein